MKKKTTLFDKPSRRKYDEEFKRSAVQMIAGGRSAADVARSLGVHEALLYKWKSAAGTSPISSETEGEMEGMRRYIKQLEMEREILKKALSIFSRTP